MECYHVLESIGEGSFGRVYKGRKKFSGQVVALKFIPKVGRSDKELRSLRREIDIMRGLRHPNIILLLDSFDTEQEVVVVTEYAEGELFQILEDDGSLPESQVQVIACQLVSALYYLHSHRILHRDMKPQNILLGKGGVVKLCDFGFARAMSVSTLVLTSIKGTPLYMSPELVQEKPYDHTADLWSLGCILYELHTGTPPFYTNSIFQLVKLIVQNPVKWPESMSHTCTSFLKGLLTKDPQKRLSWPDLLHHPFVADGVVVLPDSGSDNPLTVTPNPGLQALRLQQAKEKAAPHGLEGKLLCKAWERREKGRKAKQDFLKNAHMGTRNDDYCNKPPLRTGSHERTTSSDCLDASFENGSEKLRLPAAVDTTDRHISRDYAKEFPSVEVGPRCSLKQAHRGQGRLASVHLEKEDVDSDEEWQHLINATDPGSPAFKGFDQSILQCLRTRLMTSKVQLLDGMLEGACRIRGPLRVLSNLLTIDLDSETTNHVTKELGLPDFLFSLTEDILKNPVLQEPWCTPVLGDLLSLLVICCTRHLIGEGEKRLEERAKSFVTILLHPDMAPFASSAAFMLALFTHRGILVDVCPDKLMAAMEAVLSSPVEHCVPPPWDWGLFDGFLVVLFQTLSEANFPHTQFLNSDLWRFLWVRVSDTLKERNKKYFSLNGLHIFLSLALSVFTRDPQSCIPLLANMELGCLATLGHLLTADCGGMKDWTSEGSPAHPWSDTSQSSLSLMSCRLLCFPFALEVPNETMVQILQSYHRCDIVSRLLQLSLGLPLPLVELPLALLSRLLLCDPEHAVSAFTAAAELAGFFHPSSRTGLSDSKSESPPGDGHRELCHSEGRTASSLLCAFLNSEGFPDLAAELITLVSLTARSLLRPSLSLLYVDPSVLSSALAFPDHTVRAATCSLLGNLNPLLPQTLSDEQALLKLFQDLIARLHDHSLPVRRVGCRAVGTWLGLIGRAGGENKGKGSGPEGDTLACRVDGWVEVARGAVPAIAALLRDPDLLVRRHCCGALGNLAVLQGTTASLLQFHAPSRLLHAACADSQHEVQLAAISSLCVFSQQAELQRALVSLNAFEKLSQVFQNAPALHQHHWLIQQLDPAGRPGLRSSSHAHT
ncbi:serine/threonine-protein kinase 36 isoform X1 [Arapaima gigas]